MLSGTAGARDTSLYYKISRGVDVYCAYKEDAYSPPETTKIARIAHLKKLKVIRYIRYSPLLLRV